MIAALYVDPHGIYAGLDDVEVWGLPERNALDYKGPWAVVAHPPCARWCQMAGLVEHRYGIKRGEDGGLFAHALQAVRTYGGVLEHPAYSLAWEAHELLPPERRGWSNADWIGGMTCHVEQGHFGHPARKATWLYTFNVPRQTLEHSTPWGRSTATAWVGFGDYDRYPNVKRLEPEKAAATPEAFRDFLLQLARSVSF